MGNYQIGPRIGAGGMAEVYLGTQQAIGGFRKLVVMKRLLGWQSGDEQAVEGLLDEARIAATMNHPNIVSTLDVGLDRGSPYVVLEYLSGEDLRYVLQELHQRQASVPLGIACRIGASIAAALSQAHDLTLPDGSHRCIVHRDVTPSNIIVCYSGVTKLVDFGVARVVDDVPKTKSGMVKGKFSYLAPEQLTGAPLDGRTDVFQLGIVLWEMVTLRRLFEGKSDHERVNAVLNRAIRPPSELNPALPSCLERTIMRALDRNPARRHQTAHELESELLDALAALGASGGDHSVAKWMQMAFAERYRWRQDLERRVVAEAAADADADASAEPDDSEVEVRVESDAAESPWSSRRIATGPTMTSSARSRASHSSLRGIAVENRIEPPPRSLARYAIPALVAIAAAVWLLQARSSDEGGADPIAAAPSAALVAQPTDYEVDIRVLPAHASIAIDGTVVATGRYRASLPGDGVVHTVTFTAPDHTTVHRRIRGATTLEVNLEPLTPAAVVQAPAPEAPAATEAAQPARTSEPARSSHDARQRRRERTHDANPPGRADDSPATAAAANATGSAAHATGSGSATQPARAKSVDDSFTPSSDNIDPFAGQ